MAPRTASYRRLKKWIVALALGLVLIGGSINRNITDAANWSTRPAFQPTPTVEVIDNDDDGVKADANWSTRSADELPLDVTVSE